jgi:hypothetical protein
MPVLVLVLMRHLPLAVSGTLALHRARLLFEHFLHPRRGVPGRHVVGGYGRRARQHQRGDDFQTHRTGNLHWPLLEQSIINIKHAAPRFTGH